VVLGALGAIFGAVLAFAAKKFAVEVDERESAIVGVLPGANCGGCGYPGCGGFAASVVAGKAPVNGCVVGGAAVAAQVAEIMGVAAGESVRKIAQVQCTGGGCEHLKYDYVGIQDCLSAARMTGGGPLSCKFGCLGLGTCVSACPFDAIHVVNGAARVDDEKCVACGKCVAICPRAIIQLVPRKTKKHVAIHCSSKDKGADTRSNCNDGCIGCGICAKACPKEAIVMADNLAKIDYEKCIGCGLCAQKCPRKLITVDGVVPEPKPAPAPAK
jgi:Na+-translocating ferredoxin:NAD+ oxidoreductase RNF subunit RnfB